jgi:hypothetical protein
VSGTCKIQIISVSILDPKTIFGPGNIDNIWRIRNNMETYKLIEGVDIVRYI